MLDQNVASETALNTGGMTTVESWVLAFLFFPLLTSNVDVAAGKLSALPTLVTGICIGIDIRPAPFKLPFCLCFAKWLINRFCRSLNLNFFKNKS